MQNQNMDSNRANNTLYTEMKTRFGFSGDRTVAEFMMSKAEREGYLSKEKRAQKRRAFLKKTANKVQRRIPVAGALAILLCTVGVVIGTVSLVRSNAADDTPQIETPSSETEIVITPGTIDGEVLYRLLQQG